MQVVREELLDEEEYSDIVDDISEEIETKYGHITQINIPRPATPADMVSHFHTLDSSASGHTEAGGALKMVITGRSAGLMPKGTNQSYA